MIAVLRHLVEALREVPQREARAREEERVLREPGGLELPRELAQADVHGVDPGRDLPRQRALESSFTASAEIHPC